MVIKNIKYGSIENVTVIELGNGDVMVSDTIHPPEDTVGVMFTNDEANPIGTDHDVTGMNSNDLGIDAIITFNNIESIEVVERALSRAKDAIKSTQSNA